MKIAQVAPLFESVPPKYYGGTERIVSYLTEELVQMGHEVTLFASGDSITSARLEPMCGQSLRLNRETLDQIVHHLLMVERVAQRAGEFDIIHSHIDYFFYSMLRRLSTPSVTTLHGNLAADDLASMYREFSDLSLISISNAQRAPVPEGNWLATVHHGLPENLYRLNPRPSEYLAFLGRVSSEKRLDLAIEVARRAGMKLKIAAKVDERDAAYFNSVIRPMLDDPLVEFIGEIGEGEKGEFLGNAYALLFLIDWMEPFGLVMIESMACGTPVIARPMGSVPEVLEEGRTGYLVDGVEGAVAAVHRAAQFDRRACREEFERRFTSRRMAADYELVFESVVRRGSKRRVA